MYILCCIYQLVCRCSQCRAIRTGGGYIILDLGDENGRLKTGDGIYICMYHLWCWLSADSECYLCVDGDVCTCDGTGLSNHEGVDRDGGSLSVIREGDENGYGNRQSGSGSLGDNDGRGLHGRRRGQGTGAGDGDGGMGDRDGSGRWSRAGGESGRSTGGSRVKVCMYSELQVKRRTFVVNCIHSCDCSCT